MYSLKFCKRRNSILSDTGVGRKSAVAAVFVFLIFLTLPHYIMAENTIGALLRYPAGVREAGLGCAGLVLTGEPSQVLLNPAAPGLIDRPTIAASHSPLWSGAGFGFPLAVHDMAAFAFSTKRLGVGFGVSSMYSGEFEAREGPLDVSPQSFFVSDICATGVLSWKLNKKFIIGAGAKGIRQQVYNNKDMGFGADIGCFWQPANMVRIGISYRNIISPSISLAGYSESLLPELLFGVGVELPGPGSGDKDKILIVGEGDSTDSGIPVLRGGVEYKFNKLLHLRAGYDGTNPSFGTTLGFGNLKLHYAYCMHWLNGYHRFGLAMRFGYTPEEQRQRVEQRARREAQQYLKKGLEYFEHEKYGQAMMEWDRALMWTPGDKEIENKIKEATNKQEELALRRRLESHFKKAYHLFEEGKLVESLAEWQEILKIDPDNQRAQEYVKRIKSHLPVESVTAYEQVSRAREKKALESRLEIAKRYFDKKKYDEAVAEWKAVLRMDKNNEQALEGIKRAHAALDVEAQRLYEQASGLYGQKKYRSALVKVNAALDKNSSLADAKALKQKIIQVLSQEKKRRAVSEEEIQKMYYRAAELYSRERYEECAKCLRRLLEVDPTHENARRYLKKTESILRTLGKK